MQGGKEGRDRVQQIEVGEEESETKREGADWKEWERNKEQRSWWKRLDDFEKG